MPAAELSGLKAESQKSLKSARSLVAIGSANTAEFSERLHCVLISARSSFGFICVLVMHGCASSTETSAHLKKRLRYRAGL